MVRDQITLELWEELNRLYLFVRSPHARRCLAATAPANFFSEIKSSSLHLIGISHATLIHDEGWWFVQTGNFWSARTRPRASLMCATRPCPNAACPRRVNQTEALEWSAVLRSCSAWDAYKSIYGADVNPRNVADLLC